MQETEIVYGRLIFVCWTHDGEPYIDSSLDTTPIVGDKYKVAMVKDELLGNNEATKECDRIAKKVDWLSLRARFARGRGPWHFTAHEPLTDELLLEIIKRYTEEDFARLDKEASL